MDQSLSTLTGALGEKGVQLSGVAALRLCDHLLAQV
jgi:hypothetical protein